jgi:hypothetical protein
MSSHTLIGRRLENIRYPRNWKTKLKANPFVEFAKVIWIWMAYATGRSKPAPAHTAYDEPVRSGFLCRSAWVENAAIVKILPRGYWWRLMVILMSLFANKVDSLHTQLAKDIY